MPGVGVLEDVVSRLTKASAGEESHVTMVNVFRMGSDSSNLG